MLAFTPPVRDLREILVNQKLAALGDAYVNFIYSVALSKKKREPTGAKADSHLLAEAIKKAGLKRFLPSRIDRHKQADALEALVVYAWAKGSMTIEEGIKILEQHENMVEAFSSLILTAKRRLDL